MTNDQGRASHYGKYIDVNLGENAAKAMYGHVLSGNVAAQYILQPGIYKFRALARGHIFSPAPNMPSWVKPDAVKIGFEYPQTEEQSFCQPVVTLDSPKKGIHVPGGSIVTLEIGQGVLLVDERVGTRGNVPEVFDKRIVTPFIRQGSDLLRYLLPGDAAASDAQITRRGRENYDLVPIQNSQISSDDRVLLVINDQGPDMCYLEGNPMEIEVLSGKGSVRLGGIEVPSEVVSNGDRPIFDEIELLPGKKISIPAKSRIRYETTYGPLVLRDTSLDFDVTKEVRATDYFARIESQSKSKALTLG